jgi:hypothetical protein
MKYAVALAVCAAMSVSACASTYTSTPRPTAGQTIRYVQGVATTQGEGRNATVQVTSFGPNDKGRLVFAVAVFNRGDTAMNFGVENVSVSALGAPVRVFTYAELERMAKNDATTALVLTALAGGVAAAAASSGPTYRSTTVTPYGTYSTVATNYAAQAVASSVALAGTTSQMNNISANLDNTLTSLSGSILQTTTIDPDTSFGGQVISDRVAFPEAGALPANFVVVVGDETFDFAFDIAKD